MKEMVMYIIIAWIMAGGLTYALLSVLGKANIYTDGWLKKSIFGPLVWIVDLVGRIL